jgi:cytochrome c2
VDDIPLPLENLWRRNVRLADIAFFGDGRAAAVTFDGDVWLITGLAEKSENVSWQRFASGFHEPLSLCIRDGNVFVFDRNGIWRLRDTNGNGEADRHELFSNAFAQTAETREFASGMKLAPDNSFIIAKGGQQSSTLGKLNGTVLRVSPDGKDIKVLGWGLRQPFIGVHPRTGMITASDQQGHYVPATPLHVIRDHQYYGFLAGLQPKEKYPATIAEPLLWIPHAVNASGAGQVWLNGARMGPLNDALVHIGYSRPEIFLVRLNSRGAQPQGAVVSIAQNLEFAPLNGAVNPADGQLYVTGFQIWGSTARRTSGLARLRYTSGPGTLPREVAPMDKGILLRFDVALDAKKTADPANFSVERWNYKRTANYGSPHFKLDGTPGQQWMTPSSAYVSRDNKSVFIGLRDMQPVMQMRVSWSLAARDGSSFEQNAYLTPHELTKFDPTKEGFDPLTVDLTPRIDRLVPVPVTVQEGQRLAGLMGCTACHSVDGTTAGKVGPSWKGLFGAQREFKAGEPVVADEAYLHESILDPTAKVVQGFEKNDAGMPSYAGVLTEQQIQALILYIKTLK